MITTESIKDVLGGYAIESEVIAIFGEWVVTTDGDIVFIPIRYPIYSYSIHQKGWLAHLKLKKWFSPECEIDFLKAHDKACEILKIKVELIPHY